MNGDEDAYVRLLRRYEAQITKLMWRFSRNPAVCEELVQDVFVEAYFSLKSYRGKAPLIHWLRKIGVRVGYRYWKEQAKAKATVPLQDFDAIVAEDSDAVEPSAAAEVLHALLARLPAAGGTWLFFPVRATTLFPVTRRGPTAPRSDSPFA